MPPSLSSSSKTAPSLRADLTGKNIGLSISDNPDRINRGFGSIHQRTFMYEIARTFYRRGASISYGGHLKNEGFTAASLQLLIDEQQSAITDQEIQSYVAWPLHCPVPGKEDGIEDDFRKFATLNKLPPPAEFEGKRNQFFDPKPISHRYYWFRSMTGLRQEMNSKIHARIVLGGKLHGFFGRYPGVVEEVLLAAEAKMPVYLCGGFGGAALALAQLFQGKTSSDLDSFSQYADVEYASSVGYYEAAAAQKLGHVLEKMTPYDRFTGYAVDYPLLCEYFRILGTSGLNNGLSPQENEILFETPSLDEIRMLILTGLKRLFSKLPEFASFRNEAGIAPKAAFEQAMQSAKGMRSPLISADRKFALDSPDDLLILENALYPILGDGYLEARGQALHKCAPEVLDHLPSVSKARPRLSLDLSALSWFPPRSQNSVMAAFLDELGKARLEIREPEAVRKYLLSAPLVQNIVTKASPMNITGSDQAMLSRAIESAFPSPRELRPALQTQLGDNIWNYASLDDAYPIIREKMIVAYNSQNKIAMLVSALLNENSTNEKLLEFAWRHRLLKRPAGKSGGREVEDDSLERMLEPVRGFTDVGEMLRRLGRVVNSVCQIRCPHPQGFTYGTGFLIGNSTVLTNWHVVESVTAANCQGVRLKFDYRTSPDGNTVSPGVEFRLAGPEDWLIDYSPYAPADNVVRALDEDKALDRSLDLLDYAVLRVAGEPGQQPIGGKASENVKLRGCLSLDEVIEVQSDPQSAVWCFQHPYENGQSLPQQVDWNKPGLFGCNPNQTRVWYDINTRPGSSGSPILTNKMELIALHHAGGQDWPAAGRYLYNRGIPLVAIRKLLEDRGKLAEIK